MPDLQPMYERIAVIEGTWRRKFREGTLECGVGPARPRDKARLTTADLISGQDLTEPSAIWIVSTPNPSAGTVGGAVSMARCRIAAERVVFHNFVEANAEQIAAELKRQQDLLDERVSAGRSTSRKEDSKYGKRD